MLIEYSDNWPEIENVLKAAGVRLAPRENVGAEIVPDRSRPLEHRLPTVEQSPAES